MRSIATPPVRPNRMTGLSPGTGHQEKPSSQRLIYSHTRPRNPADLASPAVPS
jgi:hypothetical protein